MKLSFRGTLTSVQPRIRLSRSFDQRSHSYLGYVLRLRGDVDHQRREFTVAIGKAAQEKHELGLGYEISGEGERVTDRRTEAADIYKVSKLKVETMVLIDRLQPPPWIGAPPALEVYRERGHRRLDARTYETKCATCIWGCRMPVEMIVDQWRPEVRRYRFETFCYGPKSCPAYRAGPTRKVPGRNGMSWEEADWIDQEATAHRSD